MTREEWLKERNATIAKNRKEKQDLEARRRELGLRPVTLPPGSHPIYDHPDFAILQSIDDCDESDSDSDDDA